MKKTVFFQILFFALIAIVLPSCSNFDGTASDHTETADSTTSTWATATKSITDHMDEVAGDIKGNDNRNMARILDSLSAIAADLAPVIEEATERKRLKTLRDALTEKLLTTASIPMDSVKMEFEEVMTSAHVSTRSAFFKALKTSKDTIALVGKYEKIFNNLPPKGMEYATAAPAVKAAAAKADDSELRAELAKAKAAQAKAESDLAEAKKALAAKGGDAKALSDAKEEARKAKAAKEEAETERDAALAAQEEAERELAKLQGMSAKEFKKEKKKKP